MKKSNRIETAVFKVVDKGPIIKKKYLDDLHYFGHEVKSTGKEAALAYIAYIGAYKGKKDCLEVVFWSDHITTQKILNFLKKYKLKASLVKQAN